MSGAGRARSALTALLLPLAALALAGCETTAEKSAEIERHAKHVKLDEQGLKITRPSTRVRVLATAAVHSSEGAAVSVTLQNTSGATLREVPLAVTVKDAGGKTIFQNDTPGLEHALTSVPSLAPHQTLTWVDDQLPMGATPATVAARVGEAPSAGARPPKITISQTELSQEAGGGLASGTVTNVSSVEQPTLVVFAVARSGTRMLAAGRAVLHHLGAHESAHFQVFFIGQPAGGKLALSAPATTFG